MSTKKCWKKWSQYVYAKRVSFCKFIFTFYIFTIGFKIVKCVSLLRTNKHKMRAFLNVSKSKRRKFWIFERKSGISFMWLLVSLYPFKNLLKTKFFKVMEIKANTCWSVGLWDSILLYIEYISILTSNLVCLGKIPLKLAFHYLILCFEHRDNWYSLK